MTSISHEVEIDVYDVLDELSSEDLREELRARGENSNSDQLYKSDIEDLYREICMGDSRGLSQVLRNIIEQENDYYSSYGSFSMSLVDRGLRNIFR